MLPLQRILKQGTADIELVDMQAVSAVKTKFDHQQFYRHLSRHTQLGEVTLTADQLESTQALLQDNTAVMPDNTVCIAYQQIGGKGTAQVEDFLI